MTDRAKIRETSAVAAPLDDMNTKSTAFVPLILAPGSGCVVVLLCAACTIEIPVTTDETPELAVGTTMTQDFGDAVATTVVSAPGRLETTLIRATDQVVVAEQQWDVIDGTIEWKASVPIESAQTVQTVSVEGVADPLDAAGREAYTLWSNLEPEVVYAAAPAVCTCFGCVRWEFSCIPTYTCRTVCVSSQVCFPLDPPQCTPVVDENGNPDGEVCVSQECHDLPCVPHEDCSVENRCTKWCAEQVCITHT